MFFILQAAELSVVFLLQDSVFCLETGPPLCLFLFLFHNLAELESENELTSPCLLPDPAFVPVSLSLLFLLSIFTLNTEVVSQFCVELHDERLSLKH